MPVLPAEDAAPSVFARVAVGAVKRLEDLGDSAEVRARDRYSGGVGGGG